MAEQGVKEIQVPISPGTSILGFIPVNPPFNLESTLYSGQAFRWKHVNGWHYCVIFGNLVKVRQNLFGIEFDSTPATSDEISGLIRSYFRVDDNLEDIYRHIATNKAMVSSIASYRGLRLLRQEPWECLVSFICSITSNVVQIGKNVERLSQTLGRRLELDGVVSYTFPTPLELASAGETVIRDLRWGFRASYAAAAARAVVEGALDLAKIRDMPYQEAKSELMKLRGVGAKVADCVLLFSMDKLEAFPVDRHILRTVQRLYFRGKKISERTAIEWAHKTFGNNGGYAQQYLFHAERLSAPERRKVGNKVKELRGKRTAKMSPAQ